MEYEFVFLDFCYVLLILIVITQVAMPFCIPKHFKYFWLFRKEEPQDDSENAQSEPRDMGDDLRDAVKKAVGLKKETDQAIKSVRKKTKEHLKDAKDLDQKVEGLE